MPQDKAEKSKKNLVSRKEFLVGSGAIIAAMALSGCTSQNSVSTVSSTSETQVSTSTAITSKYGGVLRAVIAGTPMGTIGWPAEMIASPMLLECCLETLLRTDNKGELYPSLAESYKVADDLKSATFALRQGVKFHDGSDFNAEVAKFNLDNMIKAGKEANWASVDIIDDYTIKVNFSRWQSTVVNTFGYSGTQAYMVSKEAYDTKGIDWVRNNPVGTGPFKFVSFGTDVAMKFERNSDYWQKGEPYLDGITLIYSSEPTTQKMAMQTGIADIMPGMTSKWAVGMKETGLTVKFSAENTTGLVPDTANPDSPWSKQEVREAAEYAIDKEGIARAFGYGFFQAPYQLAGHDSANYEPDFPYVRKYDPDKARQLLAAAGYPDGFKTSIHSLAPSDFNDILAAVQSSWAGVGIQADLDLPDMMKWGQYMFSGTWQNGCVFSTRFSDPKYIDGFESLFVFTGKSWLRTPEVLAAYNTYLAAPAPDTKLALAVTNLISKDASMIPVVETGKGWAYQPYVMDLGIGEKLRIDSVHDELAWINK